MYIYVQIVFVYVANESSVAFWKRMFVLIIKKLIRTIPMDINQYKSIKYFGKYLLNAAVFGVLLK